MIEQLKRKNQKQPERIIYFGDGEWDFKACQNLRIEFIGINFENNGNLSKIGAKPIFRDFGKSKQIMHELTRK